jgi:hypothetical protein
MRRRAKTCRRLAHVMLVLSCLVNSGCHGPLPVPHHVCIVVVLASPELVEMVQLVLVIVTVAVQVVLSCSSSSRKSRTASRSWGIIMPLAQLGDGRQSCAIRLLFVWGTRPIVLTSAIQIVSYG